MFSGKTEELLRRVRRAELAGHDVELYKPAVDDRYGETEIGSHNGNKRTAEVVESAEKLDAETYVIAIDEANFFDQEVVDKAQKLALKGHRVILSGIDSTFRGEPFHPVPQLMAQAEFVEKLNAICVKCGEPAHEDDPTVVVGADEKYEARCRSCFEIRTD